MRYMAHKDDYESIRMIANKKTVARIAINNIGILYNRVLVAHQDELSKSREVLTSRHE